MVPEQQALAFTAPDRVYDWWGMDAWSVVDQRPRGYAGVLDQMVKDTAPPGDPRVVFEQMVTNVDYSGNKVAVKTGSGKLYMASAAITTFPLGVLNRKHRDLRSLHTQRAEEARTRTRRRQLCHVEPDTYIHAVPVCLLEQRGRWLFGRLARCCGRVSRVPAT